MTNNNGNNNDNNNDNNNRRAHNKDLSITDTSIEFERRRNRPERYNREVMSATLKAMKRVSSIKQRRESRFIEVRKRKGQRVLKEKDKEMLTSERHLVEAPDGIRQETDELIAARQQSRRELAQLRREEELKRIQKVGKGKQLEEEEEEEDDDDDDEDMDDEDMDDEFDDDDDDTDDEEDLDTDEDMDMSSDDEEEEEEEKEKEQQQQQRMQVRIPVATRQSSRIKSRK